MQKKAHLYKLSTVDVVSYSLFVSTYSVLVGYIGSGNKLTVYMGNLDNLSEGQN